MFIVAMLICRFCVESDSDNDDDDDDDDAEAVVASSEVHSVSDNGDDGEDGSLFVQPPATPPRSLRKRQREARLREENVSRSKRKRSVKAEE